MAKPPEQDRLLPLLLALLALVGLFNLLMGAYLYTAYENHKHNAAAAEEMPADSAAARVDKSIAGL